MNKQELKSIISSMISNAGAGHYTSSVSALEIMYPLFYEQGVKPDEFILSKGHAAPTLYAILYDLGYLTQSDLLSFRKGLPGHPSIETKGVLCSSGSLGMGISKALGLALMNPQKTYHVLLGDGELQEGQNWEAILYLYANKIKNVIIHVDCNGHQYSGKIREYFKLDYPFIIYHKTKWEHDNKYLTHSNPKMENYLDKIKQYGEYVLKLMSNPKVYVLCADLIDDFGLRKVKESDRYIDTGISEQHMVSMANGISRAGYYPICHTFSSFYKRCIDQMWNNYCDHLPIIYVAGLCGDLPINIGLSHVSNNPKELLACMPDIEIINDFNKIELGKQMYCELRVNG